MVQQIDSQKVTNPLSLLPYPPRLNSQASGWSGIYVEHHQQAAFDLPERTGSQHVVCVHQFQQPTQLERSLDGKHKIEEVGSGEIAIIPAQVAHQLRWKNPGDFTLVMLDPTYIHRIVQSSINVENFELKPQIAIPDPFVYQIVQALNSELEFGGIAGRLLVESLTATLSVHLFRHYATHKLNISEPTGGLSKEQVRYVIAFIEDHLEQDLSLEMMANLIQLSPHYFASLFKQSVGQSPHQYVLRSRIERSKQLLKQPKLAIAQIAQCVGFQNQSHFTTAFRRIIGCTPKAYRSQA
ncbi:MAG: AraC family transcriptional regulator [Drouetiella hepatica Uher 2000/2452]|jgi:AraC family transcriptional regulator|uniref:AraC family transcriptional regulator n=1 Tax=Drouetiella hepatica Uher 2000/2452 TaxID=904376 RepID=A0A951QJQ9_9CYAN|nr:AraC family transcriptional regulator [Drouetiella hepatica Uher 2000/2452]